MRLSIIKYLTGGLVVVALFACNNSPEKKEPTLITYKGLYSFGPGEKSFKECPGGREYWMADSSAQLELQYSQLNIEKPFTPVYVEVQGKKVVETKESLTNDYDSTVVVYKLIKISKDIPQGICK